MKQTVSPYLLEGYLVFALSGAFVNVLDRLDFEVEIRNRHLCLRSVSTIKQ